MNETKDLFGGSWTLQKLNILKGYLNTYTTVMKNQAHYLIYIDAFAGSGRLSFKTNQGLNFQEIADFYTGSAQLAVDVKDKPFDHLLLIEKNPSRCIDLEKIRDSNSNRKIVVENGEANRVLRNQRFSNSSRGVIFLDPFGVEVEWKTIEAIKKYGIFDVWLLFPTSAIARLMPTRRSLEEISPANKSLLNRVFGGTQWIELYPQSETVDLFNDHHSQHIRHKGVAQILTLYKRGLMELFKDGFLDEPCTLYNSKNSPLFELFFCVGNPSPRARELGKRFASHLIDKFKT